MPTYTFDYNKYGDPRDSANKNYNQNIYQNEISQYRQGLQNNLGLSKEEANVISDIQASQSKYSSFFAPAESNIRSQLSHTRFGDIYDVEKNYGGLQGLANYYTGGNQGKMTDIPFSNTPSGGRTGGTPLLLPQTPIQGIQPRTDLNAQLGAETYGNPAFSQPGANSGVPGALADMSGLTPEQIYRQANQGLTFGNVNAPITPPQAGNGFGQYYKDAQGNVFKTSDNSPVNLSEFKKAGLNIGLINTKEQLGSQPAGAKEAQKNFGDGYVGTQRNQSEQSDFQKMIMDNLLKTNELADKLLVASETSEERKKLEKTAEDITTSFEAGLRDINGKTISMSLILGQGRELEAQANDKLNALNRTLKRLEGNDEARQKTLEKAYDISRQSTQDAIAFWKLTQPDKLWVDTENGKVYFVDPFDTSKITTKDLPGFVTKDKVPSSVEEFNYLQKNNLLPTTIKNYSSYVQWKAQQYGTEDTNIPIIEKTTKTLQEYKDAGFTREDIEKQYEDAGKMVPLEVRASLDKLYPAPAITPESNDGYLKGLADKIYNIWKGAF